MHSGRSGPAVALHAGAGENVVAQNGGWRVAALPAWIELTWDGDLPAGWVLLRGRLIRRGRDFSARLFIETAALEHQQDLPVSLKGTLLELIRLPKAVKRLRLQPMCSTGELELHQWTLEPVGWLKRTAYRWRRILPVYFKLSRAQRVTLGLRGYTPLIDLKHAYYLAGNTRFYAPPLPYPQWFERFGGVDETARRRICGRLRRWPSTGPQFEITLVETSEQGGSALDVTLGAAQAQLYRDFVLTRRNSEASTPPYWKSVQMTHRLQSQRFWSTAHPALLPHFQATLSRSTSRHARSAHGRSEPSAAKNKAAPPNPSWILFIQPGVTLSEHALYWLAEVIQAHPEARLIYSDHDYRQADGTLCAPAFKPDWSPELLRSTNYIGPAVALHRETLLGMMSIHEASETFGSDPHDLLLRFCEHLQPSEIRHLAAPLWHLPIASAKSASTLEDASGRNPVQAHLDRLGIAATATRTHRGHYRVRYAISDPPPLVKVLIPTRDALEYLRPCVESLLSRTRYPHFEVLVIDNGSEQAETLAYLEKLDATPRVHVLRDARPFNFSALNNAGARQARGQVLCLLNNDTEVISPDWMETMLGHLVQPGVGVVGAKLYYSDGRVQHAGDTVGPGGCAHHLHAFLEREDPGYCDRAILTQDLSAVTAACLMTWRNLYLGLGGLDEEHLPVAFNDVDYCLRVREHGQRVVWTPHAELYHHESVSRGKQEDPKKSARAARELAYMRARWGQAMRHDPFYNLNLSYQRPDFSLSYMPMVERPWR